jgi:uncharacterized protein
MTQQNVIGGKLETCCVNPRTGFYRNGCCDVGTDDLGVHAVCAIMTEDFLKFSLEKGNDLTTARPEASFPGLKPGDKWCLCASRWLEAFNAGKAPLVVLSATNQQALSIIPIESLLKHAFDAV